MDEEIIKDQQPALSLNTIQTVSGVENILSEPLLREYELVESTDKQVQFFPSLPNARTELLDSRSVGTIRFQQESRSARKLDGVCSKFQEAAIYLQEGEENEKLYHHPSSVTSYWAYMVLHNPVYYIAEFVVSVLLMLLAFLEKPTFLDVPVWVAPFLELLFLLFLSSDVVLKLLWIKPKFVVKHYRTTFKCIVWAVMLVEALVVLGRGEAHIHVTRALRPIFVLDSNILPGVRRILRQIFQCLGPIIDVLCLLFFFIALFAISGYYLFATTSPTNFQFSSLRESFISLYIAATTANFPDVMMESYNRKPLAPLFFIIFLIITLYIITNVLLAVVYSTFQNIQKKKFRSLYLHRRSALRHAFQVLAVKGTKHRVLPLQSYLKLMQCYSPFISKLRSICTYKAMLKIERMPGDDQSLRIDEFYSFYDVQRLSWSRVTGYGEKVRWYLILPDPISSKMRILTKVVNSIYFKVFMNFVILSNMILFFVSTSNIDTPAHRFEESHHELDINFVYIGIYLAETVLKLIALGPVHYFRSYWNNFDFTVIMISFITQLFEIGVEKLIFVIPLRFLRLIRFNKRLRAIFNTLAILMPRIVSIVILLILVYYFYAIIGMEVFRGKVYQGCCNDTAYIQNYYTGNGSNVFYLNNFDSISQSYVTLFELMVINNWWIIMEGFHAGTGNKSSRVFFILFHVTTYIVLTVAIAFIVEAFVLKIDLARQEYTSRKVSDQYTDEKFVERIEVAVSREEVDMIEKEFHRPYWAWELPHAARRGVTLAVSLLFEGRKRRTKGDIHKQLYEVYLEQWIQEDEKYEESSEFLYNQLPLKSSNSLVQRTKDKVISFITYIFD